MKFKFLGACEEVGRSGALIETDKKIITDYGIKIRNENNKEEYLPVDPPEDTDMLVVTHAHLDHSGAAPYVKEKSNATVMGTSPTNEYMKLLYKDNVKIVGKQNLPYAYNAIKQTTSKYYAVPYQKRINIGKTDITLVDAGHITGSAMVKIDYQNKTTLYTGDYNTIDSGLHKGTTFKEKIDYLITESTYSDRNHPDRVKEEKRFIELIKKTLDNGGNALVPAFAVDRSQEMITIIRKYLKDVDIYLDGMSIDATEIMLKFPNYISNYNALTKALKNVNLVTSYRQRKNAIAKPSVIVTTSGMMSGGPVLGYLHSLNTKSQILLTGYCVEETNGWYLMNKGYIMHDKAPLKIDIAWEKFDFSGHIDQREMDKFFKNTSPEKIFCVHGDDTAGFAKHLEGMGFDAYAPKRGQEYTIN